MKRCSTKAAVSSRVLVTELTRSVEEAFARSDASALADALYKRALENGEPVSPDLVRYVSERSGAPGKLLEAIPVIQGSKKRTAKLREGHMRAAEKRKRAALNIAARLMKEHRRLRVPGRKVQLAELVQAELPQTGNKKRASIRTIRRWIADALIPKK
jgi:hypothetical protein